MSCPASNKPLKERWTEVDDNAEMPKDYYTYTAIMIVLGFLVPYLYRRAWVLLIDTIMHFRRPKHLRGGPAGCRPIGKSGTRNLCSEQLRLNADKETTKAKVEALFVYPIKSCFPIELDNSKILSTCLEHDRQFCFASWHEPSPAQLATAEKGLKRGSSAWWDSRPHWEFMTQRQSPSLTHVKVEIWVPDSDLFDYDEDDEVVKSGGCLLVSFPYSPSANSVHNLCALATAKIKALDPRARPIWRFTIPLKPTPKQVKAKQYGSDSLRIWRDEPEGLDMTSEIPGHILNHLRAMLFEDLRSVNPHKYSRMAEPPPMRLYRMHPTQERHLFKCAPPEEQLGYQAHLAFQDSYPIHIQNIASIKEVDVRVEDNKGRPNTFRPDSRRYRANIYVSGPPAFDEDHWTKIRIGSNQFHVSCRTTRCKLPTNNPTTGVLGSDGQPFNYLNKHRNIDPGAPQTGCLGMMMVPTKDAVGSSISVGDEVEILRRGEHFFVADVEPEAARPVL